MKHFILAEQPKISAVVPMYNGAKFVSATLDSLLKQTFGNFEIIVVNDGSVDDSERVVQQFFFDRRIRYLKKPNGGTGSALNLGHQNARGEYVTWCSADNIYFPQFLEALSMALDTSKAQNLGIELVYSDFCFMNEAGQKIHDVIHKQPQRPKDLIDGYDVGMSFMYTKKLWDLTGNYWDKICEDYDWTIRAAQHTSFGLINMVLAAFRVHGGQLTGSNQAKEKAAADECRALAKSLFSSK